MKNSFCKEKRRGQHRACAPRRFCFPSGKASIPDKGGSPPEDTTRVQRLTRHAVGADHPPRWPPPPSASSRPPTPPTFARHRRPPSNVDSRTRHLLPAPHAPSPCIHIHLIRRNNPSPAASNLSAPTAAPHIRQQRDKAAVEASAPCTRNGIRTVDSTAIRRPFDAHSTANRSHSQPPINHHARDDNRNDEYCSYDIPMPSKTPYGRLNAYYFSLRMAINPHSTI